MEKLKQTRKQFPLRRIVIFMTALILIMSGAMIWIMQSQSSNFLPNAISILFVASGIVTGLLQWLFPISSGEQESPIQHSQSKSRQSSPNQATDQPHTTLSSRRYLYDVAISYAGEDQVFAKALAEILQNRGIKVFFDKYEKATLWGKNLYDYLSDLYQHKAQYCVMFLSQHYADKVWTNLERQAAQSRAFKEHEEYILPVRLDNTDTPGILPTIDYLRWPPETAETIADAIENKLRRWRQREE
jgi:hypothetical protein